MPTIDEIQPILQNLTQAKITQSDIARALGVGRANISLRIKNKSLLTLDELKKLDKYYNVNLLFNIPVKQLMNTPMDNVNNSGIHPILSGDRIEINYWEHIPNELKNPRVASVWFDREIIENAWGMSADHLCIIPMVGDKMARYWYPIRNGDILIVDTSQDHIMGNGVYFATSQNNTRFWIREMQVLISQNTEIKGYAPSGETTKVFTKEQLEEVNFQLIGKVIKNVSFRL